MVKLSQFIQKNFIYLFFKSNFQDLKYTHYTYSNHLSTVSETLKVPLCLTYLQSNTLRNILTKNAPI